MTTDSLETYVHMYAYIYVYAYMYTMWSKNIYYLSFEDKIWNQ